MVGGGGRSLRVVLSRSLGCEHLCLGGVCSGRAGVWWLSVLVHVGDASFSELRGIRQRAAGFVRCRAQGTPVYGHECLSAVPSVSSKDIVLVHARVLLL